jgi:hypothetical protein
MKVQLLLGSTAIALSNANEINTDEDLARHRLQTPTSHSHPSERTRDLRAVPQDKAGHDEVSMSKASKKTDSKSSKPDSGNDIDSKSGKSGGGSFTSSKSNKDSKSGKSSKDPYYLGPLACPGRCVDISGINFMTGALTDVLKPCDNDSIDQHWIVHNDDTFVKIESRVYPNECISIHKDHCSDFGSDLILGDCEEHASMWYFTGGQLVSAYCWVNGYTNVMGAFTDGAQCYPGLYGFEGSDEYIERADLFMFIDSRMIEDKPSVTDDDDMVMPSPIPTYYPSYSPTGSPN